MSIGNLIKNIYNINIQNIQKIKRREDHGLSASAMTDLRSGKTTERKDNIWRECPPGVIMNRNNQPYRRRLSRLSLEKGLVFFAGYRAF